MSRSAAGSRLLVGADPGTTALTSSTTEGCNIVLAGLGLDAGDEIVTTTDEHFGLLGPLATSGARVVVVEPDPDRILAAVTPRTRLIATSQVLWTTGAVLPVRELRERSGVPVLVDGAQSAGAIPVDVAGMDFFTISGQKWLCGPDATGALVVTDPERLRVAAPSYFSQTSYERDGSFEPREGAARFEQSWWSPASLNGLLAALDQRPGWALDHAWRRRSVCVSVLQAWSRSSRRSRARHSSRFARKGSSRPRSWSACTRPASTCGSSRVAASSAPRSGTGRATTISTGWWPVVTSVPA